MYNAICRGCGQMIYIWSKSRGSEYTLCDSCFLKIHKPQIKSKVVKPEPKIIKRKIII